MPKIAIIGRQNVGKSTLFNALLGYDKSIVYDKPGVTRDLISERVCWQEQNFVLTDFPGLENPKSQMDELTQKAIEKALGHLTEYHLLLWVVFREGITPYEWELAHKLRKIKKTVWLVVNGVDDPKLENELFDFYQLGITPIFYVSALNRRGIQDLKTAIGSHFAQGPSPQKEEIIMRLAIVGKPNSGKSSYFNFLLQKDLALVTPIPGTTRDSHSEIYQFYGKKFILTDTAGLFRKYREKEDVEKISMSRTIKAAREADVVVLLVDALEGFDRQVIRIIRLLEKENKPFVVAINKTDLILPNSEERKIVEKQVKELHKLFWEFPVYYISARTGKNCVKPIFEAYELWQLSQKEIPTPELNRILEHLKQNPIMQTQRARVHYLTKIKGKRHFILFGNKESIKPPIYRYIGHELRKRLGFEKLPIFIELRDRIRKE